MKHLKYLHKYFLKYKFHFFGGIVFVTISNIFGIIPPRLVRYSFDMVKENLTYYQLINGFSQQQSYYAFISKSLLIFGALVLLMAVLKGLFMFLMRQTLVVMSRHVEYDLKNEIYQHYQKLSVAFYKRNQTGDLMSRATEDVSKVRMYLGPAVLYTINTLVLFVVVIWTMVSVNPSLTFYVLLPLPILSISIYYVSSIINRKSERIQEQLSTLTNIAQENYNGIRVVKTYVQEKPIINYFSKESEAYKNESLGLAKVQALFFPLMILLVGTSTILTIYIGGLQVAKGTITPGNIAEFVIYVNMLVWPVTSVGWIASIIQQAAASQKRINEFLFTKPEIQNNNTEYVQINGRIVYKNVHFTYPDSGIKALSNINLEILPGEKVAFVGKTGSGKSTIIDLLLRMYDVDEGEILIDDYPIKKIDLQGIRKSMAYVPQDVFLFSDTITNNISFGMDEINFKTIENTASSAKIHQEIKGLPNGYATKIGERGVTLSGGQKQRISIARALLKKVPILILDDSLSAVDAQTEKEIFTNLKNRWISQTVILITHRIFALKEFDKIFIVESGTIVDVGDHKSLLQRKGLYFELFEKQQKTKLSNIE